MIESYTRWLSGPAALVLAVALTEDGDRYTLVSQVKYAKVRRVTDKEGTFDAKGFGFDLEEIGTYAERLIATQAYAFSADATTWMQDIVRGVPNRVRFVLSAHFTRDDASADGLSTTFVAEGDVPGGRISAISPEALREALLEAFPDSKAA